MKTFYLVAAVIVVVLILIASFAQLGATCTWYLFSSQSPAFLVLLQLAGLGAVAGGLLVMYWKAPGEDEEAEEENSASE